MPNQVFVMFSVKDLLMNVGDQFSKDEVCFKNISLQNFVNYELEQNQRNNKKEVTIFREMDAVRKKII